MSPSPTEEAFSRAVRRAGAVLVQDLLKSGSDVPKNADYVFPDERVIAELKRLERSSIETTEFREKVSALYRQWMIEGKVPLIYGTRSVNLRDLPPDCAKRITSELRKPIYRRIRKADAQIRSTKKILDMPDAQGLLVLIQDGDYSLSPENVVNLVTRSLNREIFANIDNGIYINANMIAVKPGSPRRYQFFLPFYRRADRRIHTNLIQRISAAWNDEFDGLLATKIGLSFHTENVPEFIADLRFIRPA